MEKSQFEREVQHGTALAIAKRLLRKGLITANEYLEIKVTLIQKYHPMIHSLLCSTSKPIPQSKVKEN